MTNRPRAEDATPLRNLAPGQRCAVFNGGFYINDATVVSVDHRGAITVLFDQTDMTRPFSPQFIFEPLKPSTTNVTTTPASVEDAPFKLPFPQVKPGMRVRVGPNALGEYSEGRVLEKKNATKELVVLFETGSVVVPHSTVEVMPPDPLDQVYPMLAKNLADYKGLDLEQLLVDPQWGMEVKFDGERQLLAFFPSPDDATRKRQDGVLYDSERLGAEVVFRATTRVVGKNTGMLADNSRHLPHFMPWPIPTDGPTVFDVELVHAKGETIQDRFRTLRSIMGSAPERALRLQEEHGEVSAMLFDVLWFNGIDLRQMDFRQRRAALESWYTEASEWLRVAHPEEYEAFTRSATLSKLVWTTEEKREMLKTAADTGQEGVMLKSALGRYTDSTLPGQRSPDVLKVKPFTETDVVITGFEMGQGMYNQDRFGAITVAQWVRRDLLTSEMAKSEVVNANGYAVGALKEFYNEASRTQHLQQYALVDMGTTGGFTQAQEAEFRADPARFIGQAMEVKYQEGGRWPKTGRFRHSNFLRMREDKPTNECTYEPSTT